MNYFAGCSVVPVDLVAIGDFEEGSAIFITRPCLADFQIKKLRLDVVFAYKAKLIFWLSGAVN